MLTFIRYGVIITVMEYPLSVPEVAKMFGLTSRAVQNWARKNSLRTIGGGNRAQYMFFEKDIENFKNRPKAGNPDIANLNRKE
jgi:hypothetical protein